MYEDRIWRVDLRKSFSLLLSLVLDSGIQSQSELAQEFANVLFGFQLIDSLF